MAPSQNQNDPLLPKGTAEAVQPLSPRTDFLIKALSVVRLGEGLISLLTPQLAGTLFKFPIPANMTILIRLAGARDLALGELLYTAEDKNSPGGGRREIRRAFWAGIGVDVIDLGSLAYCVATGSVGRLPGALLAGAAFASLGLAGLGLRGV